MLHLLLVTLPFFNTLLDAFVVIQVGQITACNVKCACASVQKKCANIWLEIHFTESHLIFGVLK